MSDLISRGPRQSNDTMCGAHPAADIVYVRTGPLTTAGGCGACYDEGTMPTPVFYNARAYHDAYLASLASETRAILRGGAGGFNPHRVP